MKNYIDKFDIEAYENYQYSPHEEIDKEIMDYDQNFDENDKFSSECEMDDENSDRHESGLDQFKLETVQLKPKGLEQQLNRIHKKIIEDHRKQQFQNIDETQIIKNFYQNGTILKYLLESKYKKVSECIPYLSDIYNQLQIDT